MSLKKYKNLGISCFVAGAMILGGLSFFQPTKVYADTSLPQQFEYSIENMGLTIGNQGGTGLCWAYTSSKVLETMVHKFTTAHTAINISEDWISLAYMYYVNDENQTLATEKPFDNTEYVYSITGVPHFFQRVVSAYGIMLEDDFTLTETITTQNYKQIFEANQDKAHKDIVVDFDVLWAGYLTVPETNGLSYDKVENGFVNIIKDWLWNYGAVYTAVSQITPGIDCNYVFHATTDNLTHAMTIIGFDDQKQIDVGGEVKTGAFTLLNSYGDYRQIVYMPYDMLTPNVNNSIYKEQNNIISNTFVLNNVNVNADFVLSNEESTVPDQNQPTDPNDPVDPDPNEPTTPDEPENPTEPNEPVDPNEPIDPNPDDPNEPTTPVDPENPTDPNEPTEPEDPDDPNQPDDPNTPVVPDDPNDGPNDPNEDISGGGGTTSDGQNSMGEILDNLLGRFEQKSGGEKAIIVFAMLAMIGLVGVGIGFGVITLISRTRTAAINQSAFGDSVQKYRQHQLSMQQQKADLEQQIADMRAEAKKRKQRRLKREFKKKLEENQ